MQAHESPVPAGWPNATGPGSKLTDDQVDRARALWESGSSLGEIAREVGCGIYDLSPWIYVPTLRAHMGKRER